jgi:hypothetical protein
MSNQIQMNLPTQDNLLPQAINCNKCGVLTLFSDFPKSKICKYGIAKTCKLCSNKTKVERYNRKVKPTKSYSWKKTPELHKEYCKKWRDDNKDLRRFYSSDRRKGIRQATPIWENISLLKEFYKNCPKGYHVDHIIPLNNPTVCGLHTISNLQYLLAIDNLRKGNLYDAQSRDEQSTSTGRSSFTGY